MNTPEILRLRLLNTGLGQSPFKNAADVVFHLGAVQCQDFAAAKWALGLRIKHSTDSDIEKAFNEGTILRTHVMRPTWHFVTPENIRWMIELTAPRVKAGLAHSNRKLELDDELFARSSSAIFKKLLGHKYLTRQELKTILANIGVQTDVQRLAHIIAWLELDGLICSGPRRGKQFTYALLEERAAKTKSISREQALTKLATRYFTSHGPAQPEDFAWWSGLAVREVKDAFGLMKSELSQAEAEGKTYWFSSSSEETIPKPQTTFLLSIYDEYIIAYKDRSNTGEFREIERMILKGNAFTAVIVLKGKVSGTWKKVLNKNKVEFSLNPFQKLNKLDLEALEAEVIRYGKFVGIQAVLVNPKNHL